MFQYPQTPRPPQSPTLILYSYHTLNLRHSPTPINNTVPTTTTITTSTVLTRTTASTKRRFRRKNFTPYVSLQQTALIHTPTIHTNHTPPSLFPIIIEPTDSSESERQFLSGGLHDCSTTSTGTATVFSRGPPPVPSLPQLSSTTHIIIIYKQYKYLMII